MLLGAAAAGVVPAAALRRRRRDDGVVYPFAYACLVGLLQAQWTFTGYDASAHVAEETVGAQEAAPRGIVNSVWVSARGGLRDAGRA